MSNRVAYLYPLMLLLFLQGCAASLVKLNLKTDDASVTQYGGAGRTFFQPVTLTDSLIPAWQSGLNGSHTLDGVICSGNFLFVADLSGRILCYERFTGKQKGILRYKGVVTAAPVLKGYLLVFPVLPLNENYTWLTGYDIFNGAEQFRVKLQGRVSGGVLFSGNNIFALTEEGTVFKVNSRGTVIGSVATGVFTNASPAVGATFVFGNSKGELISVDTASLQLLFRAKISTAPLYSPSVREDTVLITGDEAKLFTVCLGTGTVNQAVKLSAPASMAPVMVPGGVVVGDRGGTLYSFSNAGTENWSVQLGGVLVTPPLVTNNRIAVPDLNYRLHILSRESGNVLQTMVFDGRVKHTPLLADSLLYISYDPGIIQAYYVK